MNKKILLIIAVLASAALTARANIVTNGGFETGDLTGWTQFGDTSFTAVAGTFDGVSPHSGNFQLYSGPTSSFGGLDQTLATSPGAYTVDFWLANGDTSMNNGFYVSFNGVHLLDLTNAPQSPYTEYTFTGTATGSSTVLEFGFYNPPVYWFLDDVSVSPIPEPGTLGLIALGALGLVGAVRKRRSV
jgi:PEP-CTERM motif